MESGMNVWMSVAYLAPLHYYARMLSSSNVYIEQHDNYLKQTYRNRCQIVTGNGVIPLSIPVDKGESVKCLSRDIRLSSHTDWQKLHWRSLVAAYNSSPFFEYYTDDLFPFYEKKWDFLFDFNISIQSKIMELIDAEITVAFTNDYKAEFGERELDLREGIHPKKMPESEDPAYRVVRYYQVFDQKFGFIPNMSIVDLLFNMGPESKEVLKKMIVQ
jgi:WbqC-like protein family.